jgi:hypothetical protein
MQPRHIAGIIVAAAFAAAPAMIPSGAVAATNNYSGTATVQPSGAASPSQQNPLLTENGSVRVGKLIGSDVYNNQDQKMGSVDGVVINKSGEPQVIISHDNNKLAEVPWSKLQFGNTQQNKDNKVLLEGMSKDQLSSAQPYHYTARNNG